MSSLPPDAPLIGLEMRLQNQSIDDGAIPARLAVNGSYYHAIRRAGGRPLLLPPLAQDALDLWPKLDGIVFTGGMDVVPQRYGQQPHSTTEPMPPEQDESVFALLQKTDETGLPALGICLGCQVMNVHRGGTLHQHVPEAFPQSAIKHSISGQTAWHPVRVEKGPLLTAMGQTPEKVTSRHHQAVDRVGTGLQAVAWAPDGVIEAVEDEKMPFYVGVQWHCEDMSDDEPTRRLFATLILAAKEFARCRTDH